MLLRPGFVFPPLFPPFGRSGGGLFHDDFSVVDADREELEGLVGFVVGGLSVLEVPGPEVEAAGDFSVVDVAVGEGRVFVRAFGGKRAKHPLVADDDNLPPVGPAAFHRGVVAQFGFVAKNERVGHGFWGGGVCGKRGGGGRGNYK